MRPVCISLLLMSLSFSVWAAPTEGEEIDRVLAVCIDRSVSNSARLGCLDDARDDWDELVEDLTDSVDEALADRRLTEQRQWHNRLAAQWQGYRSATLKGINDACGKGCMRNQLETDLTLLRTRAKRLDADLAGLVPASAR